MARILGAFMRAAVGITGAVYILFALATLAVLYAQLMWGVLGHIGRPGFAKEVLWFLMLVTSIAYFCVTAWISGWYAFKPSERKGALLVALYLSGAVGFCLLNMNK